MNYEDSMRGSKSANSEYESLHKWMLYYKEQYRRSQRQEDLSRYNHWLRRASEALRTAERHLKVGQ